MCIPEILNFELEKIKIALKYLYFKLCKFSRVKKYRSGETKKETKFTLEQKIKT